MQLLSINSKSITNKKKLNYCQLDMNSKIKIQHYIPVFYLRNFSINNNKKEIYCFDKSNLNAFKVNIKRIGCEKYFYDISDDEAQQIEKGLSELESTFNVTLKKLIATENLEDLSEEEKSSIAHFCAIQHIRTREYRENIKDIINHINKFVSKKILPEELKELEPEASSKFIQIRMIVNQIPKFAEAMIDLKWILLVNNTSMPYWLSDHPVSLYNPIEASDLGIQCRGIQIFLPLNPKLSLSLCDPNEYNMLSNKYDSDDIQTIIFQNHLQVRWSTRHIFSNNNDFSLAKSILERNPSLKDINRQRVLVG